MKILSSLLFYIIYFYVNISPSFAENSDNRKCGMVSNIYYSMNLPANCVYSKTIKIKRSGIILNCNGSLIDARNLNIGISIEGDSIQDIVIKNCVIKSAKGHGILIRSETSPVVLHKQPLPMRYAIAPRNISIINTRVESSSVVGIFVGFYVRDVKLTGNTISNSGGVGLYLEASSSNNLISNNFFWANGFGDVFRNGKRSNREAIAVDSSAHNIISRNVFIGNSAGGIFLYKNCWENSDNPKTVKRWQHSNYNLIEGNFFYEKKTGVWIASRQLKNLSNMRCGDPEIAPGYYRDYASFNTIRSNLFWGGKVGVNIQDDFNVLLENYFINYRKYCIYLRNKSRAEFINPVIGTVMRKNFCINFYNSLPYSRRSIILICDENKPNNRHKSCKNINKNF